MPNKNNIFSKLRNEYDWLRLNAGAQGKFFPFFCTEWAFRHATAKYRGMANCIIVGAQKSGTSSLYHYLIQHPQVKSSFGKELHYFDGSLIENLDTYKKGKIWYQAHFPFTYNLKEKDVCLDASPFYLYHPLVAERIHKLLPDSKILILLRNPIERAISHYFHVKDYGGESLPMEDAFALESDRLAPAIKNKDYKDPAFRKYSYQTRGLYWLQIQEYLKYFTSDQLLIINSDDFFKHSADTLKRVYSFLDIDTGYGIPDLKPVNTGHKKSTVSDEVYQKLKQYYKQPNQDLFEGIGQSFDWD